MRGGVLGTEPAEASDAASGRVLITWLLSDALADQCSQPSVNRVFCSLQDSLMVPLRPGEIVQELGGRR